MPLPSGYRRELKLFLDGYQKVHASKKQDGLVTEREADAIPFPLYDQICGWAVTIGNIFLWTWTILQWNCVARSSSIDPLGFHNLTMGASDSVRIMYDKSKADRKGEKVTPKNLYANPFRPQICPFVGLGVYFCIHDHELSQGEAFF